MKRKLAFLLRKCFPKLYFHLHAYRILIWNEASYLYETGWMKSLENSKPLDKIGDELPWMNYPVVSFLSDTLPPDISLFEFGSGYSTAFYAKRVRNVTSVEYNKDWFSLVREKCSANVKLLHRVEDVDGAYCRAIHEAGEKYDVVVVDGRDRVNCIKQSASAVSDRGVIILDDSQRKVYQEGVKLLLDMGFSIIRFEGLKATGAKLVETSIFYRKNNCLGI